MKILSFDTSTKFLSIACHEDEELKASYHEDAGIRHSEILIPAIKDLLQSINWGIKDIELICAGLGPGSFTGLRIAVATVKGLAAVLGTKVLGVPTMDAIIRNAPRGIKTVAPLLDARKGKVYTCVYECCDNEANRTTDYLLADLDDFLTGLEKEVFFFGDGVLKYRSKLDPCSLAKYDPELDWYPRAEDIGRIGYKRSLTSTDDPETIEPLYLHPKECNITKASKGKSYKAD